MREIKKTVNPAPFKTIRNTFKLDLVALLLVAHYYFKNTEITTLIS
jgi:hypothetical protein